MSSDNSEDVCAGNCDMHVQAVGEVGTADSCSRLADFTPGANNALILTADVVQKLMPQIDVEPQCNDVSYRLR